MMSINDVLMRFFKLPMGLRMLLAVAGFGSLASIAFFLAPSLNNASGRKWVLIVLGCGVVLYLLVWLVRRFIFGRKAAALGGALAATGPSRGDIAEQESILRDKFRKKLEDLKQAGLSVYKLPWFVLMGEPGCGKTASLIHSGLDFPLGKDEVSGFGGTRNYNWWFTNEAVILDTAGRIAFHEEGTTDKPEWEFFLRLLKSNRPRCPINGVVIALPADRLMKDTSDERAQKAGVLRERLRQIQQALGVRFPAFILVTKMDLVGGFGEYFEEVRVDLAQRNQMVGWSRPGEFQDAYDPQGFGATFDAIHARLRDWTMRFLQRRATEQELGMVATFPESFAELRRPLEDYIGTVFQKSPLVEPPFFRGFYFTSAVQEGAPIFSVFTRSKAGHAVAERPTRAVDSKAFFIHDLYARKVFPEQGLIFRSSKHVAANKRMRKLVWSGLTTMLAVMGTLFGFGYSNVADLVWGPQNDCRKAVEALEKGGASSEKLDDNVALAAELRKHHDKFNRGHAGLGARMLFIFADIEQPREYVRDIHSGFVVRSIVAPVLRQAERQFSAVKASDLSDADARGRFLGALCAYTRWYGMLAGEKVDAKIVAADAPARAADLEKLLNFILPGAKSSTDAVAQVRLAIEEMDGRASFARDVLERGATVDRAAMAATIQKGVADLEAYWLPQTEISSAGVDARIRYWVDFAGVLKALSAKYGEILALRNEFKAVADGGAAGGGPEKFAEVGSRLRELVGDLEQIDNFEVAGVGGTLSGAYKALREFVESREQPLDERGLLLRLRQAADLLSGQWKADFGRIRDALQEGARRETTAANSPPAQLYATIDEAIGRLGKKLGEQVSSLVASLGIAADADPLDYCVQQQLVDVVEPSASGPAAATRGARPIRIGRFSLGPVNKEVKQYLKDLLDTASPLEDLYARLGRLPEWAGLLSAGAAAGGGAHGLVGIIVAVDAAAAKDRLSPENRNARLVQELKIREFWRPLELAALATDAARGKELTGRNFVVAQMAQAARKTIDRPDNPGLGRLMPKFDEAAPSVLPFDRHRFNGGVAAPPETAPAPKLQEPEHKQPSPPEADDPLRPRKKPTEPAKQPETAASTGKPDVLGPAAESSKAAFVLTRYHSRAMLAATAREYLKVRDLVVDTPGSKELVNALDAAFTAYVAGYYRDWARLYRTPTEFFDEKTLAFLERCQGGMDWPAFAKDLDENGAELTRSVGSRVEALVRESVLFFGDLNAQNERDERAWEAILRLGKDPSIEPNFLPEEFRGFLASTRDQSKPDAVLGAALATGFTSFCATIKQLGPGPDPRAKLPDRTGLAKELTLNGTMAAGRFLPAQMLLDVADYGCLLLAHHVDNLVASAFSRYAGKYPFSAAANVGVPPAEFLDFLGEIARIRKEYGEFRKTLHGGADAAEDAMQLCADWESFIYGGDAARQRSKQPAPLNVTATVRKALGPLNAGANYNRFRLQLPLLRNGQPAGELEFNVLGQALPAGDELDTGGPALKLEYQWSLTTAVGAFQPLRAIVDERNPDSVFPEQLTQTWPLPADPWGLLILLSRDVKTTDNQFWRVPIRMDAQGKTIGFDLGLRFERRFPGVIAPYAGPGPRPTMSKASTYLK